MSALLQQDTQKKTKSRTSLVNSSASCKTL